MASSDSFMGSISLLSFNWAMYGWAIADGSILSIEQNQSLYGLIGANFGGNGTATFALPELDPPALTNEYAPGAMTYQVSLNGIYPERS